MAWRILLAGVLAVSVTPARAGDEKWVRLGGGTAPTVVLGTNVWADTVTAGYRGRAVAFRAPHRAAFYGPRFSGYARPFYSFYRPYSYGYYRPYRFYTYPFLALGYSYYRPYYYSAY